MEQDLIRERYDLSMARIRDFLTEEKNRYFFDYSMQGILNGADGQPVKWEQKIGGHWYYFNGSGVLQHNWVRYSGNWYYLNASGFMVTGWQRLPDGNWYYFNSDGKMQTGWLKLGKYWYYLNGSGIMVTGWQKLADGNWYYFYTRIFY